MFKRNEYNKVICPFCNNGANGDDENGYDEDNKESYYDFVGDICECVECWKIFNEDNEDITEYFWDEYEKRELAEKERQ